MQPANEPRKRKDGSGRKVRKRRDDAKFVNQEEYIRNLSDQVGKACGAWLRKRGVPDGNWRDIAAMEQAVAKGLERVSK